MPGKPFVASLHPDSGGRELVEALLVMFATTLREAGLRCGA
jgi:hypothetical protein